MYCVYGTVVYVQNHVENDGTQVTVGSTQHMRHDAVTRATHRTILKIYLFSFFLEITIETPVTI